MRWRNDGAIHIFRHCEELLRRSNPDCLCGKTLDCFAALAMTMLRQLRDKLRSRAPDAAQRFLAVRCRAGAHATAKRAACGVPALRRNAARCVASGTRDPLATPACPYTASMP
ncbi:hypothetical protein EAS61_32415 [Bradyrhizobium zhanjiangense]|uniref:Uncharacterized protein n=1 Tax=Bradyrhizobium zhanjiangense TaxID=1325107 RepID=A0A4Q0QAS5_9BRAD|nr:hypothetical protein EAS61_32415 [Bradyrhizobium zhanjiangense]